MASLAVAGALAVALAAGAVALGWLRRHVIVATVDGPSMEPTFRDGERLLARRRRLSRLKPGDVVVLEPPNAFGGSQWVIKRVVALPGDRVPGEVPSSGRSVVPDDALVVFGDNRDRSADSRQHGFYSGRQLFGVVLRKLSPTRRA